MSEVRAVAGGFELRPATAAALQPAGARRRRIPRARRPRIAASLPPRITQLHSSAYKNPTSVPDGAVLVVGTGQSGAQIAEDLHLAGRQVHLCVGSAPRVARFYRGRDCVAWLEDIGHYRMPVEQHPEGLSARREPNHYVTGRDGGHDIDLRARARDGMRLHGRLAAIEDGVLRFAGDLRQNLDAADATAERIKDTIDRWIDAQGIAAPFEERYTPVWQPAAGEDGARPLDLAATGVRTVIWATGFRSDWSWLEAADSLGDDGYPARARGLRRGSRASTCSASRGSTPGARADLPGSTATPSTSPQRSPDRARGAPAADYGCRAARTG